MTMIFAKLARMPIAGPILRIVNTYVYQGDVKADNEFAPALLWFRVYSIPILVSAALTLLCSATLQAQAYELLGLSEWVCVKEIKDPRPIALAIFPSLWGFGIGVYALIFALSKTLIQEFQKSIAEAKAKGLRSHGSVLMINADLAYPILVLTISLGFFAFVQQSNGAYVIEISWMVFWYTMITIIELIHTLFSLGENELLHR